MKKNKYGVYFDRNDPFYPSDRELEWHLAYEMGYVPTTHITRQEPFRNHPDASSVLLQEARGTREMVTSDQLPADMSKEHLARIGIEVIGPSKGDPLFVDVKLPNGWKKVPCREDSRTTYIVDTMGNRRAYAWYKAASYDRKAYGGVNVRYHIEQRNFNDYAIGIAWVVDTQDPANRRPVFQTTIHKYSKKDGYLGEHQKALYDECKAWLAENLPDYADVAAYWDVAGPPTVGTIPPWDQRTWKGV